MPTSRRCTFTATASPAWSACSPPKSSATANARRSSMPTTSGLAFQLTNIIRDVGEDARRGRIYLPQDELARFGVSEADLLQARLHGQLPPPDGVPGRARRRLPTRQAFAQLPAADRKAQRAGLIMAAIYRATARRNRARQLSRARPAHLPAAAAQALAGRQDLDHAREALPSSAPAMPAWRPPSNCRRRPASRTYSRPRACLAAAPAPRRSTASTVDNGAAHPDRRLHRNPAPDAHRRRRSRHPAQAHPAAFRIPRRVHHECSALAGAAAHRSRPAAGAKDSTGAKNRPPSDSCLGCGQADTASSPMSRSPNGWTATKRRPASADFCGSPCASRP